MSPRDCLCSVSPVLGLQVQLLYLFVQTWFLRGLNSASHAFKVTVYSLRYPTLPHGALMMGQADREKPRLHHDGPGRNMAETSWPRRLSLQHHILFPPRTSAGWGWQDPRARIFCFHPGWLISYHPQIPNQTFVGLSLALTMANSCFSSSLNFKVALGTVLVRVFIAVMEHHDQKQAGEERVYSAYTSTLLFITKGS